MYNAITGRITRSIGGYERANGLADMWREPVVKIISEMNVKHAWLNQAVSPDHLSPADILPDAKSVICFFIPFHKSVVLSNAVPGPASAKWALAYIKTNALITGSIDAVYGASKKMVVAERDILARERVLAASVPGPISYR